MRWCATALLGATLALSLLPGFPSHGYGQALLILPALIWWRHPAQRKRMALYALALLLQTLAYPQVDFGSLGFVLLLPWLFARRLEDGTVWWRTAWLFGLFRACLGYGWLGNVHFIPWITTCALSAVVYAFVFEGMVRHARFLPFAFRVATGWVAFEWVHSWFFGGLPWLYLSHTQYRFASLIQAADLFGAYGISFLLAFLQAAAFQAGVERRWRALGAAAALLALDLAYGIWRQAPEGARDGPGVLLVQCSIPHDIKSTETPDQLWLLEDLRGLTAKGLEAHPETRLVVWPETMFPYAYVENDTLDQFGFRSAILGNAQRFRRPFIVGVNSFTTQERLEANRGHNSAVLVDGEGEIRGIYRKRHLVPMGELFLPRIFLPQTFCDSLAAWLMAGGYPTQCDLEWGEEAGVLDAGEGLSMATLICFEGLYPADVRAALAAGRVDAILHLANHGWFARSWAQRQALASWVFRAIETRTPFLSCANTGISCAIDASGREIAEGPGLLERGSLYVKLSRRWGEPLFLRGGAYLPLFCLLLPSAAFLLAFWHRLRRSPGDEKTLP